MGGPKGGVFSYQLLSSIVDEVNENQQADWRTLMTKGGRAIDLNALIEQGIPLLTSFGMSAQLQTSNSSGQQVPVWKVIPHHAEISPQELSGGLEQLPGSWSIESPFPPKSAEGRVHAPPITPEARQVPSRVAPSQSVRSSREEATQIRELARQERIDQREAAREARKQRRSRNSDDG
jgi:hypothetical protein